MHMKKRILCSIVCSIAIGVFLYTRCNAKCCTTTVYAQAPKEILSSEEFFANTTEDAIPQTMVYTLVHDFLEAPLPEGKLEKKVLILGFDGYRFDALERLLNEQESVILDVAKEGGLYISYAGGDESSPQETSTAPGWASILTGEWSSQTQVYDNEDVLSKQVDTFLIEAAQKGISSAYISSWAPHFDITYQEDIAQANAENLPISYMQTMDDDDTLQTTLHLLVDPSTYEKADELDPSIVFSIFEYSDHAGHTSGYGVDNPIYMQACKDADEAGAQLLQAVRERKGFEHEEWLLVITTDHGGNETSGHGGQSENERKTWLASNHELSLLEK